MTFNDKNKEQLFEILSSTEKLVYLCGTGFSMSLGKHSLTWSKWIEKSKDYIDISKQKIIDEKLANSETNSLIEAADIMLEELKQCNKYNDFMSSTVGSVKAENTELKEVTRLINRCGDLFVTTNYDLSIENATGLKPVTYNNAGEVLKILKRESENKVVHLHGAFCPALNIDDIIADTKQYENIVKNQGAQFVQNLIGTYPIIVVGCGGTVEDPNLKYFLQFAKNYLNLETKYFYLHCKKDSLNLIPENMIPVCYGENYEDLPSFMLNIAMHRMRFMPKIESICRVNPYTENTCPKSAYSRMHYTSRYIDFIGRKEELSSLDNFINNDNNFNWWLTTGESGVGKSRLILEWLNKIPHNWFGFFAYINEKCYEDYKNFEPFSNTIIVLDYITGKEKQCAEIISILQDKFKNKSFKLRILLIERRFEPYKKDWFYNLLEEFNPDDRLYFESNVYKKIKDFDIVEPLQINKLKFEEEEIFIEKYLTQYVNDLNEPELENKYLKNIKNNTKKIHKSFRNRLKKQFQRPLYLSIFIEVWVYKSGNVSIKDSYSLLECYMEKEEKRWIERFNNDRKFLNAYLKLLALACAVDTVCVNEDCGCYQKQANIFYEFLKSEESAGRRKTSWTDLFVIIEPNMNDKSILYYIIEPLYPDLIREFIVYHYTDDFEIEKFTKTARSQSIIEFSPFLTHALEDFPDSQFFSKMLIIKPNDDREYFEYYLSLTINVSCIPNFDYVIEVMTNSSPQVMKDFGEYEMLLWRQIALVLGHRLLNGNKASEFFNYAKKFLEYLNKKWQFEKIRRLSLEILEFWFQGLYNAGKTDIANEYLALLTDFINKILTEENEKILKQESTIICAECHEKMLILNGRKKYFDKCKDNIKAIQRYSNMFPKDKNILNSYVLAVSNYVTAISLDYEQQLMIESIDLLETAYKETKRIEFTEKLAIIYTNLYTSRLKILSQNEEFISEEDEDLRKYKTLFGKLKQQYSENETIIECDISIESNFLYCKSMFFQDIKIPDNLIENCIKYKNKWVNNIEIAESLGRLLYIKICLMYKNKEKDDTINKYIKELNKLANETESLYNEYNLPNEIKMFARCIKKARNLRQDLLKHLKLDYVN